MDNLFDVPYSAPMGRPRHERFSEPLAGRAMFTVLLPHGEDMTDLQAKLQEGWILIGSQIRDDKLRDAEFMGGIGYQHAFAITQKVLRDDHK